MLLKRIRVMNVAPFLFLRWTSYLLFIFLLTPLDNIYAQDDDGGEIFWGEEGEEDEEFIDEEEFLEDEDEEFFDEEDADEFFDEEEGNDPGTSYATSSSAFDAQQCFRRRSVEC